MHLAPVSRWLAVALISWLILLGAWAPVSLVLAHTDRLTTSRRPLGVLLACVSVLSTIGFGLVLAKRRRWAEVMIAAVLGTSVLAAWYVVAMLANPQPDGTEDIAAGAGLVILAVPTLLVVLAMLVIGFLAGRALNANRRR
jgi:hypothetical protein